MAHTAHNWTPGVMKQPSNGKNGLKDLLKKKEKEKQIAASQSTSHFATRYYFFIVLMLSTHSLTNISGKDI